MTNQNKSHPKRRNASEVLTAFLAMLSQREKPLILSAHHDFGPVAEYVSKFMATNRTPKIRRNFLKMKIPPGTSHLTNAPEQRGSVAPPPMTGEEAVDKIMDVIRRARPEQTNAIVASVLTILKKEHALRIKHHERNRDSSQALLLESMDNLDAFQGVLRGNFAVLEFKPPANG